MDGALAGAWAVGLRRQFVLQGTSYAEEEAVTCRGEEMRDEFAQPYSAKPSRKWVVRRAQQGDWDSLYRNARMATDMPRRKQ